MALSMTMTQSGTKWLHPAGGASPECGRAEAVQKLQLLARAPAGASRGARAGAPCVARDDGRRAQDGGEKGLALREDVVLGAGYAGHEDSRKMPTSGHVAST